MSTSKKSKTGRLIKDLFFYNFKPKGKKGESVTIIIDLGNVLLVENSKQNKYAINNTEIIINE